VLHPNRRCQWQRNIAKLLEEYRSDPAGSVEKLQKVQDETGQLRSVLRLARDSAYGQRIR
jgi:hypothetical protein